MAKVRLKNKLSQAVPIPLLTLPEKKECQATLRPKDSLVVDASQLTPAVSGLVARGIIVKEIIQEVAPKAVKASPAEKSTSGKKSKKS